MRRKVEEKLHHLISIRDKGLRRPIESLYRKAAVCAHIPSSIDDADLSRLGYHKQCYTNFVKNLGHCQANQSPTENEEVKNYFLRKKKSTDTLFPTESIFCGKKKR